MYIKKVKHITSDNKTDYEKELRRIVTELENWNMHYDIIESRYNSDENGYKAEISYGFWANRDYDM